VDPATSLMDQKMVQWGHLVPTAPDTLSSYPFSMDDPFLLDSAPHVLFAGNQAAFASSVVEGPPPPPPPHPGILALLLPKGKFDSQCT